MSSVLSFLTLLLCAILRPTHVECPAGWWEPMGPRWQVRTGVLVCQQITKPVECHGPRGGWMDCGPPPLEVALRSYR